MHARLVQPVYAFDKEVLPAGTVATGRIVGFGETSRFQRLQSMVGGHFGSFKKPEVRFDTLLPLGEPPRAIVTETTPSNGHIVEMRASGKQKRGMVGSAVARGKQEVQTQLNTAKSFLKSEHKKRLLRDAALDLLPYQPARISSGSQFDAVLSTAQNFGSEAVPAETLLKLGQITPEEGTTQANLETDLDSARTTVGSPVEATLTAPLFAPDHTLLLPEGTRLLGAASVAGPARHFHRNGQLRFSFQQVALPAEIVSIQKRLSTQPSVTPQNKIRAGIAGLSVRRGSHVGVDEEGGTKIEESKTRFLGPAISVALVAAAGQQEQERGRVENRVGAQTAAGAMSFALIGAVIGQTSHTGALVVGSIGAARSAYSQFFGKGSDIQLPSNTLLLIQFGRAGTTLPKSSTAVPASPNSDVQR